MNNEIKEILAYFEKYVKTTYMHDSEPMVNWKDLKIVLDYITNLQQAVKNTKETADDMLYELNEENERLKEKVKHYEETQTFGDYVKEVNLLVDYKSRIDKAIEYVKECYTQPPNIENFMHEGEMNYLLNILRGDNK